jgi:hypothetical protein
MYCIRFNARLAKWQVCMLKWGIWWMPIKGAEFCDISRARDYIKMTGLSQHYEEQKPYVREESKGRGAIRSTDYMVGIE